MRKITIPYEKWDDFISFLVSESYDGYQIYGKNFICHNDLASSQDGNNIVQITKFHELKALGIVSRIICCYAADAGIAPDAIFCRRGKSGCIRPVIVRYNTRGIVLKMVPTKRIIKEE